MPSLDVRSLLILCFCLTASQIEALEPECVEAAKLVKQGLEIAESSADSSANEEKFYRDALTRCPGMVEANYNLGLMHLRRGENPNAVAAFEAALKQKQDPEFYVALGTAFFRQSELVRSKNAFSEALTINPKSVRALQGVAVVREREHDLDGAIRALEEALAIEPQNTISHFNLAAIYEQLGDYQRASAAYQRLLEIEPAHLIGQYRYALILESQKRYAESEKLLISVTKGKPDEPKYRAALGRLYEKRGDSERAVLELERAVAADPKNIEAKLNLAVVLLQAKRAADAKRLLEPLVKEQSNSGKVWSALGWAELELGELPKAEKSLLRALELSPNDAVARNNLGVLFQRAGKLEQAKREFEIAARTNPSLGVAKSNFEALGSSNSPGTQ